MKNRIRFVTLLAFLLELNFTVHAQAVYEDVVYLKNGSILHGVIIEQVPNESIKIQTADRNIFVYRIDEVLKLSKEEIAGEANRPGFKKEPATKENIKKKGLTNITEVTIAKTLKETSDPYYSYSSDIDDIINGPSIGIQTTVGYQFASWLVIGAGTGIHIYRSLLQTPFFVDVRSNFLNKPVSPFVSMQAGYSFSPDEIIGSNSDEEIQGGLLLCPAIGVKFFTLPKLALNLSIGLRYQELKVTDGRDNYPPYAAFYKTEPLRFANIRFGLTF